MKKILVIIPSLDTGGAQRAVSNFVTNLPPEYEADILLNDNKSIVYPYKGTILDLGLKPKSDRSGLWYQFRVFFRRIVFLRKLKRHNHYLTAYSFMDSANIANILSGNRYCKTVVSVRTNLAISGKNSWKYRFLINPMTKFLYRYADYVVAVSEEVKNELINSLGFYSENITTIYNGYNSGQIKEDAKDSIPEEERHLFQDCTPIVTVGRLSREKAQWHLIRIMKRVAEVVPNVRLLVLGEGAYRKYLEELIKELGLEDKVYLLGFKDNPYKYIAKAKVNVMSSLYEGFPNSLVEALVLGIPCVTTDFKAGAREILAPELNLDDGYISNSYNAEYGIIVPECDGIEYGAEDLLTREEIILADAIIKMLSDDFLREKYAHKSKEAASRFRIDKMVQGFLELS